MGKSEEVLNEIKSFVDLGMREQGKAFEHFLDLDASDQEKVLKNLEEKGKSIDSAISLNIALLSEVEKKLKDAEQRDEDLGKEVVELRERRQNAIGLGKDSKEINDRFKEIFEEKALYDDTVLGLSRRIETLQREGEFLEKERDENERMIWRFLLAPLKSEFNLSMSKIVSTIEKITILQWNLNESFRPGGIKTIYCSDYDGLELLPKLYFGSEIENPENLTPNHRLKDFFNYRSFTHEIHLKINKERNKAILE